MALPSLWCAGGCGWSLPVPAGHCPLDTGLCAAVHPSVCPAIPQSTTLPLSFRVSKWQQMNYKSYQILLQERVCVCE